ncbi:FGGY-family carbohydrate kinase [Flaviflexus massiliensis]|uniref:FGGY-family carbohydrate kinase n=1 Tax=Flaviflexus massiliensis TaxID=1522309 RepID=UPI0006D57C5A|nr:FGGY-family carbohydrate kinase [Flaviflexus massiliensis]
MTSTENSAVVIGVDIGLTGMKAVAFTAAGEAVAIATEASPQTMPRPHWVERDEREFWALFGRMLRTLTTELEAQKREIASIGISAHGDGVWLVNEELTPVRPGILSLDSRAQDTAAKLMEVSGEKLMSITGQGVVPASTGAVLRWLYDNEPEAVESATWFMSAKDFLRMRLTDTVGTDLTEASTAFTNVETQDYDDAAFAAYGLESLKDKAPKIDLSSDVIGEVSYLAHLHTGLPAGLPVIAGVHDVDAGAIGAGAVRPGQLAVMAGTWSINEVISDHPKIGEGWLGRAFVERGRWMNMSISPASSANLEWFVNTLCSADVDAARRAGESPFAFVDREISRVEDTDDPVTFLPFLYGSPLPHDASAAIAGLRAWHTRGHILRGLYEGIAFNHRYHVDGLLGAFDVNEIRVVGGVTRSSIWPQLFADTLNRPIIIPTAAEGGALGTAMLAAVGAGWFSDLEEASAMASETVTVTPGPGVQVQQERYNKFLELIEVHKPWWAKQS